MINFSTLRFLEQEVYTDILKGEKRRIDILAEVTLAGKEKIVLIHIEPQASYQKEFHERMFIYCSRLYEKHRKPILPIAVFSYTNKKEVPTQFNLDFSTSNIIRFQYLQVHFIREDWRKYIRSVNPAATALLSKMGYTRQERVQVKLEFLRMLSRLELDPAKMELLQGFFETYLKLTDEEEVQMKKEITKLPKQEAQTLLKLPNSYFEKGMEKGIKQGKQDQATKMAKKLLEKGMSLDDIADVTNFSKKEIERLANDMN
ncbi:RpnC/YadD family protein [Gracilibacillus alcaliphilus]|uniref:transposase n=1 Tax=Gracilibacillus alcaliphilus TaxID=1401441 RepID=UPI00308418AB|nr:hypothetical protein [Gracilibacillus alcaliphilus]